jgi:ribose-phosphate pyrophosphokinase
MAVFFGMPGNEELADALAVQTGSEAGAVEVRRFPDGESYVRIHRPAAEKSFLVCTLAHPDEQFLPVVFAARALRTSGARSVTLVAPYLAYLRQDRQFSEGEAVSSRIFSELVSREFNALVTVDPHLHRYASLGEVYSIPAIVVHSAPLVGAWIRDNVEAPVVLGPDEESAQWVEEVAGRVGCPWAVFSKERRGDRDVQLTAPAVEQYRERTPVLVDDIISSGATMTEAAKILVATGMQPPHCIAVHGLFTKQTAEELRGVARSLVTTDSVPNGYARLQVAPLIAEQLTAAFT